LSQIEARIVVVLIFAALLVGCAGTPQSVPVEERRQPPSRDLRLHIVDREETLYSIAFRYEKSVAQLAAINGISQPYVIYPGQRIYLTGQTGLVSSSRAATSRPAESAVPAATSTTPTRTADQSSRVANVSLPARVAAWQWPLQGRVTQAFGGSEPVSKGISIAGEVGDDVAASAAGVVVYGGAGLRGYGNLLIVKHSDTFLTAYAHNSELLVEEGDEVRQGQVIARLGQNGDGESELYFEVRENGTPVDPIRFLPAR
jgi:lipoprotein NlpD